MRKRRVRIVGIGEGLHRRIVVVGIHDDRPRQTPGRRRREAANRVHQKNKPTMVVMGWN